MTRATWAKVTLVLSDTKRVKRIVTEGCWQRGDAPLAVTPNTQDGQGWQISHVESGAALWPNRWTLADAKRACDALLKIEGWDRPFPVIIKDRSMRERCERLVNAMGSLR